MPLYGQTVSGLCYFQLIAPVICIFPFAHYLLGCAIWRTAERLHTSLPIELDGAVPWGLTVLQRHAAIQLTYQQQAVCANILLVIYADLAVH